MIEHVTEVSTELSTPTFEEMMDSKSVILYIPALKIWLLNADTNLSIFEKDLVAPSEQILVAIVESMSGLFDE